MDVFIMSNIPGCRELCYTESTPRFTHSPTHWALSNKASDEISGVVEKLLHQELYIIIDYHWLGVVKKEHENAGGQRMSIDFGQSTNYDLFNAGDS